MIKLLGHWTLSVDQSASPWLFQSSEGFPLVHSSHGGFSLVHFSTGSVLFVNSSGATSSWSVSSSCNSLPCLSYLSTRRVYTDLFINVFYSISGPFSSFCGQISPHVQGFFKWISAISDKTEISMNHGDLKIRFLELINLISEDVNRNFQVESIRDSLGFYQVIP